MGKYISCTSRSSAVSCSQTGKSKNKNKNWLQNWSPLKIYILTTCNISQSRKPLCQVLSRKPLCQVSHNSAVVGQDSHLNTKHFKVHCIQQSICLLSSPCRVNLFLHCQCHSLSYKSEPENVHIYIYIYGEPVWPSGKAGKRKNLGSIPLRLSFLFKKVVVCGHCPVTLSMTSYWNIKIALIAAHLNAEVILVVTV